MIEKRDNQIDQTENHELTLPPSETIQQLEHLERETHLTGHKKALQQDILDKIDVSDGIDAQENAYLHIVEDFFDDFLDDRGLDDVSDNTKNMLIQRIQTHGYTMTNMDTLAKNLHAQSTSIEGQTPEEKKRSIEHLLASAIGEYVLDQLDTEGRELPIHEQFALLAALQEYTDHLDEEQKERRRQMREKLLAELFERKNLEIYEVVIDESGRVIVTMKDPHGERVTIAYDPADGTLSRIDTGAVADINPADQTKVTEVVDAVCDQQSLPYDPEDTGTLLQFLDL